MAVASADHMQIICNALQTDNHASTSSLNFTGRKPFQTSNQQCQSTEGRRAYQKFENNFTQNGALRCILSQKNVFLDGAYRGQTYSLDPAYLKLLGQLCLHGCSLMRLLTWWMAFANLSCEANAGSSAAICSSAESPRAAHVTLTALMSGSTDT